MSESRACKVAVMLNRVLVREITFTAPSVIIGRDATCPIRLDHPEVSRRHAEIKQQGDVYALVDMKSVNGCTINDKRVEHLAVLKSGDRITIGPFELRFEILTSSTAARSTPSPGVLGLEPADSHVTIAREKSTAKVRLTDEHDRPIHGLGALLVSRAGIERRHALRDVFQIGSCPDCDLVLEDATIPWKIALVISVSDELRIYKVAEKPAIAVNGNLVPHFAVLRHGDTMIVGEWTLKLDTGRSDDTAQAGVPTRP